MTIKIFFSYAHEDEELLESLLKHLKGLQRSGHIDVWYDREISAGAEREHEIKKYLNEAQIILLLVSPDFLASDYCYSIEMERALERQRQGEALVIPVILRHVDWVETPFGKLQTLPTDAKPVASWHDIDEAFFDVAKGIRKALEGLLTKSANVADEGPEEVLQTDLSSLSTQDGSDVFETPLKSSRIEVNDSFIANDNSEYIKYVCPSCSKQHYLGDCDIVSRVNPGTILQLAPQGSQQHEARLHPEPLISSRYVREMACRRCFLCDSLLPYNIERVENIRIAVVGDSFSGKSHYIASLIHELQEGHMQEVMRFASIDDEGAEQYIKEYYKPLFLDGHSIPLTQPATKPVMKPLMYDIVIKSATSHATKRANLMIYDASGEDYTRQDRIVEFCSYLFSANAIIFLIDPMSIRGIFAHLPLPLQLLLQPTFQYYRGRVFSVLNTIIQVFDRFNYSEESKHDLFSVPMAVTLSKSDILRPILLQMRSLERTTRYDDVGIDLADIDAVDEEVKELLRGYGQRTLLRTVQAFSHVKFFATSATGRPADENDRYMDIEPCRCVDPLRWIFYQHGIIDVPQTKALQKP